MITHPPQSSPWGKPDDLEKLDEHGLVIRVGTSSHGGIGVHRKMSFPNADLAKIGVVQGDWLWFEEDCDWAAAAVAFPQFFSKERLDSAKYTLLNWLPDVYESVFGHKPTPDESFVARKRHLENLHKQNYLPLAGYGDWAWNVPAGYVYCVGRRSEDSQTKGFLVPKEQYIDLDNLVLNDFPLWEPDKSLPYTKPKA